MWLGGSCPPIGLWVKGVGTKNCERWGATSGTSTACRRTGGPKGEKKHNGRWRVVAHCPCRTAAHRMHRPGPFPSVQATWQPYTTCAKAPSDSSKVGWGQRAEAGTPVPSTFHLRQCVRWQRSYHPWNFRWNWRHRCWAGWAVTARWGPGCSWGCATRMQRKGPWTGCTDGRVRVGFQQACAGMEGRLAGHLNRPTAKQLLAVVPGWGNSACLGKKSGLVVTNAVGDKSWPNRLEGTWG